jgi:hypothetical protein
LKSYVFSLVTWPAYDLIHLNVTEQPNLLLRQQLWYSHLAIYIFRLIFMSWNFADLKALNFEGNCEIKDRPGKIVELMQPAVALRDWGF